VLPKNWGQPNPGPRGFGLLQDGLTVKRRYELLGEPLGGSRQLDAVFDIARRAGATSVFLDRPYVDLDYRSDLAHFYGRAFRPPPDATERLLFGGQGRLIGAAVVRPLPQMVGRTLLEPPADEAPYVCCVAEMPVHAFGYTWRVQGFPFTSQDGEYGVCAHAAIWSIARYHHLRFGTDRQTTSAIIDAAGLRERPDRTARSDGLYGFDIIRAFRGIGLPAQQYDIVGIKPPETLDTVAARYLNSGIPVGVLTSNHMLVLVGYGVRADGSTFYIVGDDNHGPYERRDAVLNGSADAWTMLVVPQPGRMHVNGEAGATRAEQTFEDRLRADKGPSHLFESWARGELYVRTYAAPSHQYLGGLRGRGIPDSIWNHHVYAPKPNWLWISEFHDPRRHEHERVVGEIAVDATSLQLNPSPVFGNVDGWAYFWASAETEEPSVIQLEPAGATYASALPDRTERASPPSPADFAPATAASID